MSVKHSRAGSRLIHACPCVRLAPKDTLMPRSSHRSPYIRARYIVLPPRDQAWENLSLAIIVYLSSGSDRGRRYVPVSRPVPHPSRIVYYTNWTGRGAIKIPSVPSLLPPTLRSIPLARRCSQFRKRRRGRRRRCVLSCFCLVTIINFKSRLRAN